MARASRIRRPSAAPRRPNPATGPGGARAGAERRTPGTGPAARTLTEVTPLQAAPGQAPMAGARAAPSDVAAPEQETVAAAAAVLTGAMADGAADLLAEAPGPAAGPEAVPSEEAVLPPAPDIAGASEAEAAETPDLAEGEAVPAVAPPEIEDPAAAPAAAAPEAAPPEPSPEAAVGPATRQVSARAAGSATNQGAAAATGGAMAASNRAEVTQRRRASAAGAAQAEDAPTEDVDRQTFRQQLRAAIDAAMPPPESETEARRLMDEGGEDAAAEVQGALGGHVETAAGGMPAAVSEETQPDPASITVDPDVPLEPEAAGEPPSGVSAGPVVPPPSRPDAVDMSANRAETDALAAENNVTDAQLARGNDPQFDAALGAKSEAEAHDEAGPAQLREAEAADRSATRGQAQGAVNAGLTGFHTDRVTRLGNVAAQQTTTSGLTATRKAEITATLEGIGQRTRTDVTTILTAMTTKAGEMFQEAIEVALKEYDLAFDDVRGGLLTRVGDFFTGGGDERFERALAAGRSAFQSVIDDAIEAVATYVEGELARARLRVEEGRAEIDRYIKEELPEDEREFADEASTAITADLDALEGEIEESRNALVNQMVSIYRDGIERRNAREEELRLANRSLWERVYDATVGVVEKIIQFKNMLLGILARAAAVVEAIIDDPIQFLTNLIAGIKAGLERFMGNIVENLKQALMGWLFGALEGAGLTLPDKFDLQGFLSIVLQVLGLTKENVRARAVRILGEETVARIEGAVEILRILFTEGPGALWEMLLEKIGNIKDVIIAEIRSWVITQIIEAGIKWILGLLNPAGAFVKACMMIYDIVVFFIERGQQIITAVNTIINTLGVIVAGNIAAMATAVEGALNRILPVVISFLASLLGLGGISDTIRNFIEAVQRPVNTAIDWIIEQGLALARQIGGLFGGGQDEEEEEEEAVDPEVQAQIDTGLADLRERNAAVVEGGEISEDEAQSIADGIRRDHPVFRSIDVVREDGKISYAWSANPNGELVAANDEASFTVDEITRAKVRAFDMVRDELMNDPAYVARVERYRQETGPLHGPLREDQERMPPQRRDVVASSGRDMFALGDAMSQNIEDFGGSRGLPDTVRVFEREPESARDRARATTRARRSGEDRPNVLVYGGRNSTYAAIERQLQTKGAALGLTSSGLDRVLRHWFIHRQLPDDVPGDGADTARIRAADRLAHQLRHADTIRMLSERLRAPAAMASTALGLFESEQIAASDPDTLLDASRSAEPSPVAQRVSTATPESGTGAAAAMRHRHDTAHEQDVRDPRPNPPQREGAVDRRQAFDEALAAHDAETVRQVQLLLSSPEGADIKDEETLAVAIAAIIRRYLLADG